MIAVRSSGAARLRRARWAAVVLIVSCGVGGWSGCGPRVVEEALGVVPGERVIADLPPDTQQRFVFDAGVGELLVFGVEVSEGGPVDVSLREPGGEIVASAAARAGGGAQVVAVTRRAGRYSLSVQAVDPEQAVRIGVQVETRRRARREDRSWAEAVHRLARAEELRGAGDRDGAIEAYQEALEVSSGLVGARRAGAAWRLGELLNDSGRPGEAAERLEEARGLFAAESDALGEARVLLDLGDAHFATGRIGSAEAVYGRALELYRKVGVRSGEATALHDLGLVASTVGDMRTAVTRYEEALALWEALELPAAGAVTLQGLGTLYSRVGRDPEAAIYLERALSQIGEGDPHARAVALMELGWSHHLRGEPELALGRLDEALEVAREARDDFDEAAAEDRRGTVLRSVGRTAEARRSYRKALELFRRARAQRGEAYTLTNLGWLELDGGEAGRAVELFRRAEKLFRSLGDEDVGSGIRAGLGRAERMRGNLDAARRELEAAVHEVEERRGEVPGALSRSYFVAVRYDAYEELAAVLAELDQRRPGEGFDREALRVAEAARSRGLLERLTTRSEVWRRDPRRRRLLGEIRELERRRFSNSAPAQEMRRLTDEILEHWLRLEQLEPPPPEAPESVNVEEMQGLLDEDTVMVVYLLGEPVSLAWTVDRREVTLHRLAGREVVDRRARQAFEALRQSLGGGMSPRTESALEALSEVVLRPLAERLDGRQRLVVLADGPLHVVPFAALPLAGGRPVVDSMEVVNLPSASVLAWQREARRGRPAAAELLAAVADPVVQAEDERLTGRASSEVAAGDLQRTLEDLDLEALPRLPGSLREAQAIAALAPAGDVMLATGFAANRELVMDGELGEFQIVHFATHGLLNPVHPGLSGIVLSLYDSQGNPQEGFVRASDIADLDLGADLVVLSACQTASGPEVRGEGMVGLVDAMFAAGAQRVVASLWKVNDGPTSDLMEAFYDALLVGGRTPSAALRAAQVSMRNREGGGSPYDWAAFNLYGDWLPLSNLPAVEGVGRSRADDSEP